MKNLNKIFIFFALLIAFSSCVNDIIYENEKNSESFLVNRLDFKKFREINISQNLELDLSTTLINKKENYELIEIKINEIIKVNNESSIFKSKKNYEIVSLKKINNEDKYYLIEIFTSLKSTDYNQSITKLQNFTGTLNVYDLISGNLINQIVIYNGLATNPSENLELIELQKFINLFSNNLHSKLPACNPYITITIANYTDHFNVWSTSAGGYLTTTFSYSEYTGTHTIYMAVPYDCAADGDSHHEIQRVRSNHSIRNCGSQIEFINKINSTGTNGYDIKLEQQPNGKIAKLKFNLLPWCGVQFLINETNQNPINIQNVTSNTFGFTIGYTWNQSSYSQNTIGNQTILDVIGTISYNMFAQGIGEFYTSPTHFQIIVNNITGAIISGTKLP